MKRLFFLLLTMFYFVAAQTPVFTDFVSGTAQAKDGQATFYLQNLTTCVLEQIQVRVSHSQVNSTTDAATFITQLQPKTQGTFVMRLTQATGEGWAWTIDALTLGQPENPTCPHIGLVAFEEVVFSGATQTTAQVTTPAPEINRAVTREYTVVAGDSWWSIAQRYGTTPDVLARLNGRSTAELAVGEVIQVPAPAAATEAAETSGSVAAGGAATTTDAETGFVVYTVKQGDTLFGIASSFDTTVDLIRLANCLVESDALSVNQRLQLPPKDAVLTKVCN